MVLSNKKLKQKLREAVTESLTASEEAKKPTDPNSLTRESIKSLLGPAALKSKLKRREKRRETVSSKALNLGKDAIGSESEGLIEKKEKKRKRDNEVKSESVELEVNKLSDKKKKKKKKKKKSEKKGESENGANGASEEIHTIETNNATDRPSEKIDIHPIETKISSDGQDTGESAMKVYVGGIPYYSSEDDIRSYFESCGTITEIDCMMFPESGKFRGIAIITFKTDAAAKRALALDGSDMGGLFLKVAPYKATKAKKYTEDFAPSIMEGYNRIYAGNLSWDITEDDLKNFFSGCNISAIRFGEDKESGEFKGYVHVDFADSLSLNKALKLDQEIVCGRPVRVRCAVPSKKKIIVGNSSPKANETSEVVPDIVSADVAVVTTAPEEVSGKIRRRTCYECGEKGHLSSSCPKKKAADQANGGET